MHGISVGNAILYFYLCKDKICYAQHKTKKTQKYISMNKQLSITFVAAATMLSASCVSHYEMQNVDRSRILIDSRYDKADAKSEAFIAPFRAQVDSVMGPVVGKTAKALESYQPESPLSNLLSDILLWSGKDFDEKPDFAIYNVGGIRAAFPKGNITYGDVLDVAPFENKLCFCSLTGEKVTELFQQMAGWGGQGVSRGVAAVMDKDLHLLSLKINGEEVDPKRVYRIATLDYVAEGNDRMVAFKSKTDVKNPGGNKNNVRDLIIRYFKEASAKGIVIDANVEGRFVRNK